LIKLGLKNRYWPLSQRNAEEPPRFIIMEDIYRKEKEHGAPKVALVRKRVLLRYWRAIIKSSLQYLSLDESDMGGAAAVLRSAIENLTATA